MYFYNQKNKETPNKIVENLYLGNALDSEQKQHLIDLGIKYILIAGNYLHPHFPEDFKYKQIFINDMDSVDILKYFEECHRYKYNFLPLKSFIKEGMENGGCFVHCAAGVSRSSTIVISYLMKQNRWKFNEAFKHVANSRSFIFPNYGFQKQLKKYEVILGIITEEEYEQSIKNPYTLLDIYK